MAPDYQPEFVRSKITTTSKFEVVEGTFFLNLEDVDPKDRRRFCSVKATGYDYRDVQNGRGVINE